MRLPLTVALNTRTGQSCINLPYLVTEPLTAVRAHPEGVYQPEYLFAVWEAATRAFEGTFLDENLKQIPLQHYDDFFIKFEKS